MLYYVRKVNGVVPPVPMELKMTRYDLDLEGKRAADGTLIRNYVGSKMKFEFKFPIMNKSNMTAVLQMLDAISMTVEYEDMFYGTIESGTFYHGDISVDILKTRGTDNSDVWFKEFAVNLIEY